MTDRECIKQFIKLVEEYQKTFLVQDTTAYQEFCFAHSEQLARILKGRKK